jgi:hypothetical protein
MVFHLALLAVHVVNAWLVFLIGRRLLPDGARGAAFLAGLLFLVFSSHSEAVAWVAGAADPLVALWLLSAFLCFLRARDADASPAWTALSLAAVVMAALAKELWVVFPGLVIACAACYPPGHPAARRRTIIIAAVSAALVGLYLAGRVLVFGSVTGGFGGLGTTIQSGHWLREIAKFLFRCVLPAGPWVLRWWPLAGILAVAAGVTLVRRARGDAVRPLTFTGAATIIALVPVLPLSISIVSTESERFTYTATAFSSLLIVCAVRTIAASRAIALVLCGVLIAWHAAVLRGSAARVHAAGAMARSLAGSFANEVRRRDPDGRAGIFLLNLPDNVGGTYVFRSGFGTAIRLVAPEALDALSRTDLPATHGLGSGSDVLHVRQETAETFTFDAAPNALVPREMPDTARYRVVSRTPSGYRVQFARGVRPTIVLSANAAGGIEYAGIVTVQEQPFGALDLPADGAVCSGASMTVGGWALDDEGVERVRIEGLEASRVLGEAFWRRGARPDVAALFPAFPGRDRAAWEFELPCAAVPSQGLRLRVTAVDRQGRAAVLGERAVAPRR